MLIVRTKSRPRGFFLFILVVVAAVVVISALASSGSSGSGTSGTVGSQGAAPGTAGAGFTQAENYIAELTGQEYLDEIFTSSNNPAAKLYLPYYAYSQAVVHAGHDVNVFGQVRVLGQVVSQNRTQLGYGAMVTAVPDYVIPRLSSSQNRFHITEWKEL